MIATHTKHAIPVVCINMFAATVPVSAFFINGEKTDGHKPDKLRMLATLYVVS